MMTTREAREKLEFIIAGTQALVAERDDIRAQLAAAVAREAVTVTQGEDDDGQPTGTLILHWRAAGVIITFDEGHEFTYSIRSERGSYAASYHSVSYRYPGAVAEAITKITAALARLPQNEGK